MMEASEIMMKLGIYKDVKVHKLFIAIYCLFIGKMRYDIMGR